MKTVPGSREASDIVSMLTKAVPADCIVLDADERRYYSMDAFWQGELPVAVVQPATQEETIEVVRLANSAGFAIVPRGGGMSYTRGYTPQQPRTVMLDLRRLDRVVEIDETNMFVTAEAGCTWMTLYETLKRRGLRTPYFGPMSGMRATVGGALSQNSMFYGSATYGTVAESVLGLKVVLAGGRTLTTGSGGNRGGIPFHRYFGPDLTGLFLSDTGALGVKLEATIRLIHDPEYAEFGSFAFEDFYSMIDVQAEIARRRLSAECFGLDPYLNGSRTLVKDIKHGLKALAGLATGARTITQGLADAVGAARAGPAFMDGVRYSLHVVTEGETADIAKWRIDTIRKIVGKRGREIEPTIPKVCRATPFKHPGEFLVGHAGERWIPIHACIPLSRARAVFDATMSYFESRRDILEKFSIRTSHLTGSAGTDLIFEPAFYYPDALTEFHLRNLQPADAARYASLPVVQGATEAVQGMLRDLAAIYLELGAVHQQIGKFYRYRESLEPGAHGLISAIKRTVDPHNLMNPGSLGF